MKRRHLTVLAAMLLIAAVSLSGCSNRTKISSILDNPDRYMNKEVSIGGTITKTYGVDLIIAEAGAYQVDDGTGKIWVTTNNGVPQEGRTVGVKGTVSKGLRVGGQTFGMVLREIDRRTK